MEEECGRPKYAKQRCRSHYAKFRAENLGPCSVTDCGAAQHTKGMCGKHAYRMKKHGSADDSCLIRSANEGPCSVDGCDSPMRKRSWCAGHYSQWRRTGSVTSFSYKWGNRGVCKVCGAPCEERGKREYCSSRCQVLVSRVGGIPPETKPCQRCGKDIDLFAVGKSGRKKRMDAVMCRPCQHARKHTRHHMSVERLVDRDGTLCSICGEEVDLALKKPDMFSPSVDHIIPYSLGGTHDPENLALAHLWCNQVKNNRVGWSFTNP